MTRALAKIHIAKKELGLDDDSYRDVLERMTGQTTAKGLNDKQAGALLDEFKRLGWKPKVFTNNGFSPSPKAAAAAFPSANKARALWISLWQLGAIRNASEAALEAFAKRQLKCEVFAWADQQQVYKLIEALKSMAQRAGWPTHANQTADEIQQNHIIAQCKILGRAEPSGLLNCNLKELRNLSQAFGNQIQGRRK